MYKIVITKLVDNPNFKEELEAYTAREQERVRYGRCSSDELPYPMQKIEENALATVVDEEQFKAVQKSILETFNKGKGCA